MHSHQTLTSLRHRRPLCLCSSQVLDQEKGGVNVVSTASLLVVPSQRCLVSERPLSEQRLGECLAKWKNSQERRVGSGERPVPQTPLLAREQRIRG
jgi:hypothetical protein